MKEIPIIKISNITKSFPGVKALDNVSVDFYKNEVHAICGENGAGKSTLINILAGNFIPNSGEIELNGKVINFKNHAQSLNNGISVVYQERSLAPNLSIAENIFADRQPTNRIGIIDKKALYARTKKICDEIELYLKPSTKVGKLTPAQQQMVEIAKALSVDCEILILDEPTASITERETEVLFKVITDLKEKGLGIIYISHRLEEIEHIADKVTVLKDGQYVNTLSGKDILIKDIIKMMVGREITSGNHTSYATDENALVVRDLSSTKFSGINFELKKGEVLGFAGLIGAGRTELFRAIFGADPYQKGEIYINNKLTKIKNTEKSIKLGIGYLPEDRKEQGLFLRTSIANNIVSGNLDVVCNKWNLIDKKKITKTSEKSKRILNIATPTVQKIVNELSGGNQQKVVFAKWLLLDVDILIIDEPTRGIDVGTKFEIYRIIREIIENGASVVIISSELPELLNISDRIYVMNEGKITGEFAKNEATEEKIMHCASGL